ncbi:MULTISPECIES: GyrI-like domain-containing protein [unclassified Anaerofustis]|uniref:GyrI-like domain-containing protein n=1 Tax=Anaerofustis TaxID=264995 RepID=UPI00209C5E6D|nr:MULTISPECIES: GyrI-like domain-containing protein [unclassified Anaerofustis]MCO8192971.1 GyrI-like domain-containing protein [Anaerofustis sp. NSJ-163]
MKSDFKLDYKKEYKDLYMPKKTPSIIEVPKMNFIMVKGKGNPNTSIEYKNAMEILYGLSFTIKMSKMSKDPSDKIDGYFEYVVPPLEGFWWVEDEYFDGLNITNKDDLCWYSMIRQPEFVTKEVFERAKEKFKKKNNDVDFSNTFFKEIEEGLCVQIMHMGSYDDEKFSIEKMNSFIEKEGYKNDFSKERLHHEIYLSDPRRVKNINNLKTVIRHPIKK